MYTADNNGSFQQGWDDNLGTGNWWMDSTKAYYSAGLMADEMEDFEIFFCPAAANKAKKVEEGHVNFGVWDDRWLDKTFNRFIVVSDFVEKNRKVNLGAC